MKAQKIYFFMSVLAMALVMALFFIEAQPITAQGPNQDPYPTPQPNFLKPTPTPPLNLKTDLEQRSEKLRILTAAPLNDDFDSAIVISNFPYTHMLDTTGATVAPDDPNMGCGAGVNSNTVWYKIAAPAPGYIEADTFGSNYDTVLAVFTGSRGALNVITCNDDTSSSLQSKIRFRVQTGIYYYLEIADYGSPGGGWLQLNVNFHPLPQIDVPLDIVLLQDETGSMWDDIGSLQRLAPEIWDSVSGMARAGFRMSVIGFRDYARSPWGDPGDWVYRLLQDFTTSRDAYVTAINSLTANGGNDGPESQYAALYYMLTPSHPCIDSNGDGDCADPNDTPAGQQPSFRSGAKKIILLATDAPFHDPDDTPGYPGPTRDIVLNALRASNTTVIGLVPGGEGQIPEVDELALATGGSVQDTGSSGEVIAEAIARALGEFQSRPGTPGSLFLSIASLYRTNQPIIPTVRVNNPTYISTTYTVVVSMLHGGTILDSQTRDVTVPGGGSAVINNINFGTRPAGSYQLVAELWLGTTRLQVQGPVNLQVLLSPGQERAISEGGRLKQAADAEFDEMRDIVVDRYADSWSELTFEALNALVGLLRTKLLKQVGETIHLPAEKIGKALQTLGKHADKLEQWWAKSVYVPIHDWVRESADEDLAPLRREVAQRQLDYETFVSDKGPFIWTSSMSGIVARYERIIRTRVEWEIIPGLTLGPIFGPTTLGWENAQWSVLKFLLKNLGIIALVAAIVLLIVLAAKLFVTTAGVLAFLAGVVDKLAAIAALLSDLLSKITLLKLTGAIFAMLLAMVMYLQVETFVGPAVNNAHYEGIENVKNAIQNASGFVLGELRAEVLVEGNKAYITTDLINAGLEEANPIVETTLYSVDGDVVDLLLSQPKIGARSAATLKGEKVLRSGHYRAVTAIHTREGVIATTVDAFEVPVPTVEMSVELEKAQLSLGEAVHAVIVLTNTNPVSPTGMLTVLALSSDQINIKGWEVELPPAGSQRFYYSFVPQLEGPGYLRVFLADNTLKPLKVRDMAYLIGEGAALVVNYEHLDTYLPGVNVSFTISAINSGNQPTTTVISLQTFSLDTDQIAPIYETSRSLSLSPGESAQWTTVVLPAAYAEPGRYAVRVYLGDNLYRSSEFSIEAQDTLFADIYPNNLFYSVGEIVTLTVEVMNSIYTYTDAMIDVTLWRPDGITQTVSMNAISTGRYQGIVETPVAGTYLAKVALSRTGYRTFGDSAFFVAGQPSQLLPIFDGRPLLNASSLITVTVRNELGAPVVGASLVISGTSEYLVRQTDRAGQVVVWLTPTITEPYRIYLEKQGFATALVDLPIWIALDVTPPPLFLNIPSITNHTPLTVTGISEPSANVTVNDLTVMVDSQGRFTTTVALSEGVNTLRATATDSVSNTTTITRSVTLDTMPPTLSVIYPPDGLITSIKVISVTGTTEPGTYLSVNGTPAVVDPTSGTFRAWILLEPGLNLISVEATDLAGNTVTITRRVILYKRVYLPLVLRNYR
jgi:hypothetical protein